MGKYIRKSKLDGALMDVSPSSLGVLTRAKSLALQRRLQKPSPSSSSSLPPTSPSPSKRKQNQQMTDCGGSYLQLRSRRLQKKSPIVVIRRPTKRRKGQRRDETCGLNPNPNPQKIESLVGSIRGSLGDGSKSDSVAESAVCGKRKESNGGINKSPCVDTSFGENFLELQGSERATRESTPCSLTRQPEMITSPGSSTKLNNVTSDNSNRRDESLSGSHRRLPTTPEMNEFFSGAEEEQQKQFIEKYNFDPVNEQPLPGRFEWTKVDN